MEKLYLACNMYDEFWSSLIGMSIFGAESQNFGARFGAWPVALYTLGLAPLHLTQR